MDDLQQSAIDLDEMRSQSVGLGNNPPKGLLKQNIIDVPANLDVLRYIEDRAGRIDFLGCPHPDLSRRWLLSSGIARTVWLIELPFEM
jgi:hypothetical protein